MGSEHSAEEAAQQAAESTHAPSHGPVSPGDVKDRAASAAVAVREHVSPVRAAVAVGASLALAALVTLVARRRRSG